MNFVCSASSISSSSCSYILGLLFEILCVALLPVYASISSDILKFVLNLSTKFFSLLPDRYRQLTQMYINIHKAYSNNSWKHGKGSNKLHVDVLIYTKQMHTKLHNHLAPEPWESKTFLLTHINKQQHCSAIH